MFVGEMDGDDVDVEAVHGATGFELEVYWCLPSCINTSNVVFVKRKNVLGYFDSLICS